jgi:hypothetical protein
MNALKLGAVILLRLHEKKLCGIFYPNAKNECDSPAAVVAGRLLGHCRQAATTTTLKKLHNDYKWENALLAWSRKA